MNGKHKSISQKINTITTFQPVNNAISQILAHFSEIFCVQLVMNASRFISVINNRKEALHEAIKPINCRSEHQEITRFCYKGCKQFRSEHNMFLPYLKHDSINMHKYSVEYCIQIK